MYTYASYEEEHSLCELELRSLLESEPQNGWIKSKIKIDPSRSPFLKERISVLFEEESYESLLKRVASLHLESETFKVIFVKNSQNASAEKIGFEKRRAIEREIGMHMKGVADLRHPKRMFGIMEVEGKWVFGDYVKSEPIWFRHQQKPHSYSTALNTRVARAIVNIAIPDPRGIKAIDPCCGIGTVLVEALSMGIAIVGSDRNPLVLRGARANIAHFGLSGEVNLADIRDITDQYDVAIIDLPYNLCSVITREEKTEMLLCARKFARKVLVVTVEHIDEILIQTGFDIIDRAVVVKGSFTREVIVCK